MSGTGGKSRRRVERQRRSTYVKPAAQDARNFRRKLRKGWAAF